MYQPGAVVTSEQQHIHLSGRDLAATRLPFNRIPLVSLEKWFNGNPREKAALAQEVNSICRSVGFMYLSNHRIPRSSSLLVAACQTVTACGVTC